MKYLPLFSVNVKHDYYADGECPDFSIIPSNDTTTLLKNQRGLVKYHPSGIRVLLAMDEQQAPIIPLAKETTFTFLLRLQNADFPLFTDLSTLPHNATPVYTNTGATLDDGVTKLLLTMLAGGREAGIFAQVAIRYAFNQAIPGPQLFELRFTALQAHWLYYFVTDLRNDSGGFHITDTLAPSTTVPTLLFTEENRRDLKRTPDAADAIASALLEQYPDLTLLRFASDQSVPCRWAARKGIQLRIAESPVVEHLPAPGYRNRTRVPIVTDGNQRMEDARFHIVKYISYPSLTKV